MHEDYRNTPSPVRLHEQEMGSGFSALGRHDKALQQVARQESA
jgi:hypothetical protein